MVRFNFSSGHFEHIFNGVVLYGAFQQDGRSVKRLPLAHAQQQPTSRGRSIIYGLSPPNGMLGFREVVQLSSGLTKSKASTGSAFFELVQEEYDKHIV